MFGTDFEMISKMFPGRTRHKIKLKFVKEEKVNYDKIRATLLGEPLPVDLPEFEKMAGTEFDDPEELEKDIEEDRQKIEEQIAATKQAIDDAKREREAQIAAERAAAIGEESSAKENRGRKARRKKGEKGEKRKKSGSRTEKHAKRRGKAGGDSVGRELGEATEAVNQI
jgi:transcription factor TFIIIB component B''